MLFPWKKLVESAAPDINRLVLDTFDHWLPADQVNRLPSVVTPREIVPPQAGYRFIRWHKLYVAFVGEGHVIYPGGCLNFRPGQIAIIPPNFPHRMESTTQRGRYAHLFMAPKTMTIYYNVNLREKDRSTDRSIRGGEPEIKKSSLILTLVNSLASAEDPVLREGLTMSLIAVLREEFSRTKAPTGSALVNRCRSYVEQELSDPALSVARIAAELRVHPDHLSRAFHAEAGVRLISYIQSSRIQMARELLTEGKLYPTEVSYLVGFSDPGYFAKVFRKMSGTTPSDFQESAIH